APIAARAQALRAPQIETWIIDHDDPVGPLLLNPRPRRAHFATEIPILFQRLTQSQPPRLSEPILHLRSEAMPPRTAEAPETPLPHLGERLHQGGHVGVATDLAGYQKEGFQNRFNASKQNAAAGIKSKKAKKQKS